MLWVLQLFPYFEVEFNINALFLYQLYTVHNKTTTHLITKPSKNLQNMKSTWKKMVCATNCPGWKARQITSTVASAPWFIDKFWELFVHALCLWLKTKLILYIWTPKWRVFLQLVENLSRTHIWMWYTVYFACFYSVTLFKLSSCPLSAVDLNGGRVLVSLFQL
jgi:hypothetical protein